MENGFIFPPPIVRGRTRLARHQGMTLSFTLRPCLPLCRGPAVGLFRGSAPLRPSCQRTAKGGIIGGPHLLADPDRKQRGPDPMLSRWLPMIMTRPLSFARPFANTLTERLSASRVTTTGQSRTAADAAHLSFFFKRPDSMSEGKTVPRKVLYGPRAVRARSLARSAVRTDPLPVGGGGGHRRPTDRPTATRRRRERESAPRVLRSLGRKSRGVHSFVNSAAWMERRRFKSVHRQSLVARCGISSRSHWVQDETHYILFATHQI